MKGPDGTAAAGAAIACLGALAALRSLLVVPAPSFVVPAPLDRAAEAAWPTLPRPATTAGGAAPPVLAAAPSAAGLDSAAPPPVGASLAGAAAAVAAVVGLAARLGQRRGGARSRGPRVAMWTRGQNFMRPNAKGTKPLIHRSITKDIIKDGMYGWLKKYRKASDIEDIMKKCIYGSVQFQFASKQFVDDIPWFPIGAKSGSVNPINATEDHLYDDKLYMRKYLNPAKFKKLEIVNWEMPEAFTKTVTMQELVAAGMQFGHAANVWNPKMLRYLYSESEGTHIFDLVQTAACFNRACYYAMEAASKGAVFLIAGTKAQASPLIRAAAERLGAFYCDTRFVGGLLTNFMQVRKGVELMKKMRREREQGAWRTESEVTREKNELKIGRLIRKYEGVQDMLELPDILIVVDEVKERGAVAEAARIGIPIIALIDSNSDPTFIDLPIPGNASGSKSIDLVVSKLTEAILRGQALLAQTAPGDKFTFEKEWDPWIFSRDRLRYMRRRSKRQPWMKTMYGGYEKWKKAHPFGRIKPVAPFDEKFSWKD